MEIHPDITIGLIASEMEGAIPLFEQWKIDYACSGNLTLKDACVWAGLPIEEAVLTLRQIERQSSETPETPEQWSLKPLPEVIDHVIFYHHSYTRLQIEKITNLLEKVTPIYGFKHPQLVFLKNLFKEMASEILAHMSKEEEIIFPYLVQLEHSESENRAAGNPFKNDPFFRQPVRILEWEHHMTSEEWMQVHLLTDNYTLKPNAGPMLQTIFEEMKKLEKDIHVHVHLESNIIFSRAVKKGWLE